MESEPPTEILYKIPEFALQWPRTRIVCTLGPASATAEVLRDLVKAGVSVVRINLSHGTPEQQREYYKLVRDVSREMGHHIGVLFDLPGPKYRTGNVPNDSHSLEKGETIKFSTQEGAPDTINVWPNNFHNDVSKGTYLLVDDGAGELEVEDVQGQTITCRALNPSEIKSRKTVSIPGSKTSMEYFTKETVECIKLAQELKPDFLALSCVQCADEIQKTREMCHKVGYKPQLMAKIELAPAMDNLEEIIDASDAVMVARGDLGIELPLSDLPNAQKRIINMANAKGKPSLVATQMIESMMTSHRPTRAEVIDINNAVSSGTDALMLSGETAVGMYPVKAVQYMAEIARRAEESTTVQYRSVYETMDASGIMSVDNIIAYSAKHVSAQVNAKMVVAFTESGATASRVATFRPDVTIMAAVRDAKALAPLSLQRGVIPVVMETRLNSIELMFYVASEMAIKSKLAQDGDYIVVVMGIPMGIKGYTNLVRIIQVPEPYPSD